MSGLTLPHQLNGYQKLQQNTFFLSSSRVYTLYMCVFCLLESLATAFKCV